MKTKAKTKDANNNAGDTPALAPHEVLRLHFGEERWVRILRQARSVMGWDEAVVQRLCKELLEAWSAKAPGHPDVATNAAACALLVALKSNIGPKDEARLLAARKAMHEAAQS